MNLTYFATSYIDYDQLRVESFINNFYNTYKTEPDIYGFNGFDITYYFLNALFRLDRNLTHCLEYVPQRLLLGRYDYEKDDGPNYQNTHWNLIRYQDMSRKKLPDIRIPEKQ
jgi:hypothetical protein